MKKCASILLATSILAAMMAGCSGSTAATTAAETKAEATATEAAAEAAPASDLSGNFVMGTGGVSGTWYPLGGAMCNAMTKGNLNVTVQSSGGGVENLRTVIDGERDFGFASPAMLLDAYNGTGDFEGEDGSKLCTLVAFAPTEIQFMVRKDSGITCVKDFAGKRFGVGAVGSGDEAQARRFLAAAGLTYDDVDEQMLSIADQATAFKDRQLDIMFTSASAPTSGFLDASAQIDCTFVPVVGEEQENVIASFPVFQKKYLTHDMYSFIEEDAPIETLGYNTLLVCSADMDEEVVYQLLCNMFEDTDTLKETHASMADFGIETATDGIDLIPIHPGAIKFYKEKGVM